MQDISWEIFHRNIHAFARVKIIEALEIRKHEKRVVKGGLWHGSRISKIEDHGHKKFVFPNRENKKARYSF